VLLIELSIEQRTLGGKNHHSFHKKYIAGGKKTPENAFKIFAINVRN